MTTGLRWRVIVISAVMLLIARVDPCFASVEMSWVLHLSVTPVKDTVLTHESLYFVAKLEHHGMGDSFLRTPFVPGHQFVEIQITNLSTGEDVPVCGMNLNWIRDTASVYRVYSGQKVILSADLLRGTLCALDSIHRVPRLSPGRYRALVIWKCVQDNQRFSMGGQYVLDSLDFVVAEEIGQDIEGLKAFLDARRMRFDETPAASVEALWKVAKRYPESPYAGQALGYLSDEFERSTPLPPGVTRQLFAERFVRQRPYDTRVRKYVGLVAEELDSLGRHRFFSSLADSLPTSVAGQEARRLLDATKPVYELLHAQRTYCSAGNGEIVTVQTTSGRREFFQRSHDLVRWRFDGSSPQKLCTFEPDCPIGGYGGHTYAYARGDDVYLVSHCEAQADIDVWYADSGSGLRHCGGISRYRRRPDGRVFWDVDSEGNLVGMRLGGDNDTWVVVVFSPDGPISVDTVHIDVGPPSEENWQKMQPSWVRLLPESGRWLCFFVVRGSTYSEYRKYPAGQRDERPRDWLVYWVIDPETEIEILRDAVHLDSVSYGSVDNWLEKGGVQLVERDSTGVSFLMEGGMIRRRNERWSDTIGTKIHLVRFSPSGEVLNAADTVGLPILTETTDSLGTPVMRTLRNNISSMIKPDGSIGIYRLIEVDKQARLKITDVYATTTRKKE